MGVAAAAAARRRANPTVLTYRFFRRRANSPVFLTFVRNLHSARKRNDGTEKKNRPDKYAPRVRGLLFSFRIFRALPRNVFTVAIPSGSAVIRDSPVAESSYPNVVWLKDTPYFRQTSRFLFKSFGRYHSPPLGYDRRERQVASSTEPVTRKRCTWFPYRAPAPGNGRRVLRKRNRRCRRITNRAAPSE